MRECIFVRKCRFRIHNEKRLCAHADAVKQRGRGVVEKCPDELNCKDCSHMIRKKNGVIKKQYSDGSVGDVWLCYCRKGMMMLDITNEPRIWRYYPRRNPTPDAWKKADTCKFYEGDENG